MIENVDKLPDHFLNYDSSWRCHRLPGVNIKTLRPQAFFVCLYTRMHDAMKSRTEMQKNNRGRGGKCSDDKPIIIWFDLAIFMV